MKPFVKGILLTGVLAMAAGSTMMAQTGNRWSEQLFQTKYGRMSPIVEARVKAEQANTAYREESTCQVALPSSDLYEGWYRAKFGSPSPAEAARLEADQASTAYREEAPIQVAVPANSWSEQRYRAKYGRPSPAEEVRLKAQAR